MRKLMWSMALLAGVAPSALAAQQRTPPANPPRASAARPAPAADSEAEAEADGVDVVVSGTRDLPGAVKGDIPADQQLSPADIRSYGVSSVADLLTELGPQLRSGRGGPPVVLLNGRRVAGFQEIRDLPTEAILRVDILPEEVALKFGYQADQRVINFVLRPRFQSVTAELEGRIATEGGRAVPSAEFDVLKLNRNGRINIHAEYQESSALTEAERGIAAQTSSFALGGNVTGIAGAEIDPRLSALVGTPVAIAGVPGGIATPGLADFAANGARANATDPTPFRTLLPASRAMNLGGTYATALFADVNATFNARIEASDSRAQQGLAGIALTLPAGNRFSPFAGDVVVNRLAADRVLGQSSATLNGHFGATFNGNVGSWQWQLLGTYDRVDSETFTDIGIDASSRQARINANDPGANPFLPGAIAALPDLPANRAFSSAKTGGVDLLVSGAPLMLPAGRVSTSFRVGGQSLDFTSRSVRGGLTQSAALGRSIANGQLNIDVPLTSRTRGFLGAIGNLSGNFNLAYDGLSDFGTLRTLGYGFNWAPIEAIRLIGSVTDQDSAPSVQQLGNPVITTLNVRVFDFTLGRNATVTTLSGGNPALRASSRHVERLGLTVKPLDKADLVFTASYVRSTVDGAVANFPSNIPAIEAAFPDRFTRDAAGQLLRIDVRPVNFDRTERSELRYGFNLSLPLKSRIQKQIEAFRAGKGPNPFAGLIRPGARPPGSIFGGPLFGGPGGPGGSNGQGGRGAAPPAAGQAVPPGQAAPGGQATPPGPVGPQGPGGFGGRFGGGGGRFGGGPGQAGGRLQFALYHTWHLTDRVRIGAAGPVLDLLEGDTITNGGGQPRHEIEAQAGYNNNGLGVRLSANWQSATQVNAGLGGTGQTLDFGSLATVNLRLFGDLGQRIDLLRRYPWLRGVRVVVAADNLFNARQRVTDANGVVPFAYQGPYLDPLGRSVRISVRKLFF